MAYILGMDVLFDKLSFYFCEHRGTFLIQFSVHFVQLSDIELDFSSYEKIFVSWMFLPDFKYSKLNFQFEWIMSKFISNIKDMLHW